MKLDSRPRETKSAERLAFAYFLRTGRRMSPARPELKFNPNHDPRNGQFTFAIGGGGTLSRLSGSDTAAIESRVTANFLRTRGASGLLPTRVDVPPIGEVTIPRNGINRPLHAAEVRSQPRMGRGGNGGPPMTDPMTLERVFPGLENARAGVIIAMVDNLFGLTAPAQEATMELTRSNSRALIQRIQAIDPRYRFDSLSEPQTIEGQLNQIKGLRMDLAVAHYRVRGEVRPLQVEALRFL